MVRFVEFKGPNGTLRGTLHVPDGTRGPRPGAVLMHGFTGDRIESGFLFVGLSRALEASGVASLRFDFSGSGESDGEFRDMTISGERADAPVALDFFAALDEIDAERVGLLGLSLGGLVAACTLGARPEVKAAVLWSAVGDIQRLWNARIAGTDVAILSEQGWIDRAGLRLGKGFVDDLGRHKPYDEIARYAGPVLVVHGTADESVPLDDAKGYVRMLEGRGRGAVTEHLFVEGGGHVFGTWPHRQAVYRATADWFARRL